MSLDSPAASTGAAHHAARSATPRSLAVMGDAADIGSWSGIPYFFFNAGRRLGFLTHALNLADPAYQKRRLVWRMQSLLQMRRAAGYQYSKACARHLWNMIPAELRAGEIISHLQFFPRAEDAARSGTVTSFYIDATMRVLWGQDRIKELSPSFCDEIIANETAGYHHAKFVVAMAHATARSLIEQYHVDPAKVFVVRAGANIDEAAVQAFLGTHVRQSWRNGDAFSRAQPAVLGFVGNDYKRKGLLRLVEAAEILDRRGRPVQVQAIGNCPESLQKHPLVKWLGWINKQNDTQRFLEAVSGFAIGALLSSAEPLGISTLECLRLGVPVIGTDVGGIPDCVPSDAGILVRPAATGAEIADAIEQSVFDPQRYAQMCAGAAAHAEQVTWDATVRKMVDIWNGRAARR